MENFDSRDYLRFGIPSLDELICGSSDASGVLIRTKSKTEQSTTAILDDLAIEHSSMDKKEADENRISHDTLETDSRLDLHSSAANIGTSNLPLRKAPGAVAGTTSLCMIGPDGTGKSVLAMHIVAHYAADMYVEGEEPPRIFYVSTDLKYEKALIIWNNFGLYNPYQRLIRSQSFPRHTNFDDRYRDFSTLNISMHPYAPFVGMNDQEKSLAEYICTPQMRANEVEVAFVDLASETAGDDWSYLNRMLALLEKPLGDKPRHLLVLDAVEGLQTLVGTYDAFGEERTRRSRIAQLMRTAEEKCHIVLVIEEPKDNERLPEEFVTDVVVRLRSGQLSAEADSYVRRTVEIDKARAQKHVRGQHGFVIRTGQGSSTLTRNNPDDPATALGIPPAELKPYSKPEGIQFGYVQVFHSLHYLHRAIMEQYPGEGEEERAAVDRGKVGYAGFGLTHLDNLLGGMTSVDTQEEFKEGLLGSSDIQGLPFGKVTALIGETGTHKNRLATAFLSRCFAYKDREQVAVLLTTYDMHDKKLIESFCQHLGPERAKEKDKEAWRERIICRRLEKHDLSAATLFHIIRSAVREAKLLLKKADTNTYPERQQEGRDIRLVITNLDAMRATYPDVQNDPLFLPALIYHLGREGVTSLLVQVEEGGPNNEHRREFTRTLIGEADHHLFTWHVPFYGEDRIAIAAVPPVLDDHPAVIRELRCVELSDGKKCNIRLEVDPGFEIYTGLLEKERPMLVPLEIRLWGGSLAFHAYIKHVDTLFKEHFAPLSEQKAIVVGVARQEYDDLMSFSFLQGNSNLDHTVVIQVDEFWSGTRSGLLRLESYLDAKTVRCDLSAGKLKLAANRLNDPFTMFQYTVADADELDRAKKAILGTEVANIDTIVPNARHTFFKSAGFRYLEARKSGLRVARVPYTWDFGFLLLRKAAWAAASERSFVIDYKLSGEKETMQPVCDLQTKEVYNIPSNQMRVSEVWDQLTKPSRSEKPNVISWRQFLQACAVVARVDANDSEDHPQRFDVDMLAPETFSCLVLEMWASEIYPNRNARNTYLSFERHQHSDLGLIELLEKHIKELYRIWFLMGEVFSAQRFGDDWAAFQARPADARAVAARHWYSSACQAQSTQSTEDPLCPARLPGHYSVRGDWFLGLIKGSRSARLGQYAIDILSSRRMNVTRLQEGIGLPTRYFTDAENMKKVWTRLCYVEEFGKKEPMTYEQVINLGVLGDGTEMPAADPDRSIRSSMSGSQENFHWLWRYPFKGYDRHSRVFLKLLRRLLSKWPQYLQKDLQMREMRNGFEAYDKFDEFITTNPASFKDFCEECNVWIKCLQSATPYDDTREDIQPREDTVLSQNPLSVHAPETDESDEGKPSLL